MLGAISARGYEMFVKAGVVLVCVLLFGLAILGYALMGLAEEASATLTWLDRTVGMLCFAGFVGLGVVVAWKLWPTQTRKEVCRGRASDLA